MKKRIMITKDDFSDDRILIPYIAKQLAKGRLSLILGAGVSVPFGLPKWEDLIKKLYKAKKTSRPKVISFESLAEYFRSEFYKNDYDGYIKAIHKDLYEGADTSFHALRLNRTLAAIGSLVMASRRGSVSEVITFNFDNLLELYLSYHGFVTKSSSLNDYLDWVDYSDVTVYHLHGMIPFDIINQGYSKKIIFDQKSFSEIIGQENNPWRQLVLTLMRRHICLFIGLSGDDMNLDSILCSVHKSHTICVNKTPYWEITFSTDGDPVKAGQWEDRGVFYKNISNYEHDLPEFLFSVCQEAAKII